MSESICKTSTRRASWPREKQCKNRPRLSIAKAYSQIGWTKINLIEKTSQSETMNAPLSNRRFMATYTRYNQNTQTILNVGIGLQALTLAEIGKGKTSWTFCNMH